MCFPRRFLLFFRRETSRRKYDRARRGGPPGWGSTGDATLRQRLLLRTRQEIFESGRIEEECLSKAILFGECSLRRALTEYVDHFHAERNHQGKGNVLLFPRSTSRRRDGPLHCRERLGGLLRYYHREAA